MAALSRHLPTTADKPRSNKERPASANYPFWNAPIPSTTILRFLPDGDANNQLPFVEVRKAKLFFAGRINSDYDTHADVEVSWAPLGKSGPPCPHHARPRRD